MENRNTQLSHTTRALQPGEFLYEGVLTKPLKSFPHYAVTIDGRVISFKGKQPRVLKAATNKGYLYVCITADNHKHFKSVHRLVAQAFLPNPENKPEVNHKDSNRANARLENLEWVTPKENTDHSRTGPAWEARIAELSLIENLKFDPRGRIFTEPRALSMLREGATIYDVVKHLPGVTLKRQFITELDPATKRYLRKQGVLF
ncbi:HNH homing endonuclease [Pseudomonas chlororaphis subsp. aurantiaca]|uniref:HNH endonuclease signature motif containing protein n=1 Tax=Pseudomonas chlororaphis TaxID=587753 RepID=UPI000F56FA57|nr:HNH endonuclease signature motif containing protein [Pseudomonas chlororaphis]AZD21234.1 HNH homing endonuclease [Pseudomonas chlororaphis subsp. aurantiaca]